MLEANTRATSDKSSLAPKTQLPPLPIRNNPLALPKLSLYKAHREKTLRNLSNRLGRSTVTSRSIFGIKKEKG